MAMIRVVELKELPLAPGVADAFKDERGLEWLSHSDDSYHRVYSPMPGTSTDEAVWRAASHVMPWLLDEEEAAGYILVHVT